ncbi:hypothetical protein [Limnohabitans sp.]|uniref:hypothetical protein n=1 Tax=Limnohabitans sp. TaxID=1907725 RepID=UPI0038B7C616
MIIIFCKIFRSKELKTLFFRPRFWGNTRVTLDTEMAHLFLWVFLCHVFFSGWVFAQTAPKSASALTAQEQIKALLDPIRGLNTEINSGLQKIEQTCAMISKMKINEAKQLAQKAEVKSNGLRNELNGMRQITLQQSELFSNKVDEARQRLSGQVQACEQLPARILNNEACTTFRANKEVLQKVNEAGSYFYSEALGRVKSYEQALELEASGCTRPGFFIRLWSAEQSHLMPTLKTSAQSFSDLLK